MRVWPLWTEAVVSKFPQDGFPWVSFSRCVRWSRSTGTFVRSYGSEEWGSSDDGEWGDHSGKATTTSTIRDYQHRAFEIHLNWIRACQRKMAGRGMGEGCGRRRVRRGRNGNRNQPMKTDIAKTRMDDHECGNSTRTNGSVDLGRTNVTATRRIADENLLCIQSLLTTDESPERLTSLPPPARSERS